MMGMGKEIAHLRNEAEMKHVGFCMCRYSVEKCYCCPYEFECLKLFVKEKAEVENRTLTKMREVQDGR